MLKQAFVYGVAKALKDVGILKLGEEDLAELAEAVAEELPGEDVEYAEPAPEEVTTNLAANLIELANNLEQAAGAAHLAAGSAIDQAAATDEETEEEEGAEEEEDEALKNASWLLKKLSQTGATATGNTTNTLSDAEMAEAKMEEENRPEGYANTGMGVQEHAGEGLIGTEVDRQGEGGPLMSAENSATATVEAKSALWRLYNALRKHSQETGATVTRDKEVPDAATGEGIVEKKERPIGYAQSGQGKTEVSGGEVGRQEQHEKQERHEGDTNEAAKVSEEQEYLQTIRRLGQKYAHLLPWYLDDVQKLAALQYLAGISPGERAGIMRHIEKTGELPEGLQEYVEKKKEEAEEKEPKEEAEEAKEEKKEDEKKAALLRRLRRLSC